MTENIIEVRNVSKSYGGVVANHDISLDVPSGKITGLIGPNGSGKTTLFNSVVGYHPTDGGSIKFEGQEISEKRVPDIARLGMLRTFQQTRIYSKMDCMDNMQISVSHRGRSVFDMFSSRKGEIADRAEVLLEFVGLYSKRNLISGELSFGQQKLLEFAMALMNEPKVLLLDEPLGALDKKLREQMQLELRDLQREVGITFVFVTHDQEEALTMSDRIAVMRDGKALEIDGPVDLYEKPKTPFCADFLGTMNFFEGSIDAIGGGEATVKTTEVGTIKSTGPNMNFSTGDAVSAAIRPENMKISFDKPTSGSFMEGKVRASAFLGDRAHVYINVEGRKDPVLTAMQNMGGAASRVGGDDHTVWLTWSDESVILLPQE